MSEQETASQSWRNERPAAAQGVVTIPIFISWEGGSKPIQAFARSADAELVCHPAGGDPDADSWKVTHRHTGTAVNPCRVTCKEAALALIDIYTPLADWSLIRVEQVGDVPKLRGRKWVAVRRAIERAYENFPGRAPL